MREITSRKNPVLAHMKRLGSNRVYRQQQGEFLCDGVKLYQEAVKWGAEISCVLTSDPSLVERAGGADLVHVPEDVLTSISPQRTPQPIVFSCRMSEDRPHEAPDQVLILDGVQDPGNVGAMIRSANAFYLDQVILTGTCADRYNPKTVRAAMGALFRQRVCVMTLAQTVDYVRSQGLTLIGAALMDGGMTAGESLPARTALAIGNEGQGLSQGMLEQCDRTLLIPMNPACESLNASAAASILLWEMYRGRRERGG